jgi:putative hemolysin
MDYRSSLDSAVTGAVWAQEYPFCPAALPQFEARAGRYAVRFARTRAELDAVLKLRFEVFNLELGEGLSASFQTGRDLDEFDEFCHHLLVEDTKQGRIVGAYRMQTSAMAAAGRGFYSAKEFDLTQMPIAILAEAAELGRACIAKAHRNTTVLFLLWKGLAAYLEHNRKRYLFGCCSLTSQEAAEGARVLAAIKRQGQLHPQLFLPALPGYECGAREFLLAEPPETYIPKLFRTYLRFGAKVCSTPALDRQFKTIDFLVIFDLAELAAPYRQMFFP